MLVKWKTGDTEPLQVTLTRDRKAQDLRGASVVMNMVPVVANVGTVITRGAVTVDADPLSGRVEYAWGADETAVAGAHRIEFEVTWGDGTTKTFPDDGHLDFVIDADLG